MHVLLIGGTRFVGYFLTWRLLAGGHRVTLLNRGTLADPFGERVERLHVDRRSPAFAGALAGRSFDAVVDFAAYDAADARGAVEALRGRVGHYLFISTGQVYLVRQGAPRPAREADYDGPLLPEPADPRDRDGWIYGVEKRAAEELLAAAWEEHQFPATRLRIPMVNGERDYYRRIESYLWRLLDGGPVLLPDGGTQVCRHVYGQEVARLAAGILGSPRTFGQAYNLCQQEEVTVAEAVRLLAEILGSSAPLVPIPAEQLRGAGIEPVEISPFSGRWMSHLDPTRAQQELGFTHRPLRSYYESIVSSFLAHPPSDRPAGYAHRATELALLQGLGARG
ncbi:MAG: NAD-dependent epimerase/dehydratase family protein [Armatimonadota bacterium]